MKVLKYYPYRTGIVRGIEVLRELTRPLEEKLHELNGTQIDNHVCLDILG